MKILIFGNDFDDAIKGIIRRLIDRHGEHITICAYDGFASDESTWYAATAQQLPFQKIDNCSTKVDLAIAVHANILGSVGTRQRIMERIAAGSPVWIVQDATLRPALVPMAWGGLTAIAPLSAPLAGPTQMTHVAPAGEIVKAQLGQELTRRIASIAEYYDVAGQYYSAAVALQAGSKDTSAEYKAAFGYMFIERAIREAMELDVEAERPRWAVSMGLNMLKIAKLGNREGNAMGLAYDILGRYNQWPFIEPIDNVRIDEELFPFWEIVLRARSGKGFKR